MLHVQSISAWAPACIGPYAQAACGGRVLYLAGQIGLDPASMQLVQGDSAAQVCVIIAHNGIQVCGSGNMCVNAPDWMKLLICNPGNECLLRASSPSVLDWAGCSQGLKHVR